MMAGQEGWERSACPPKTSLNSEFCLVAVLAYALMLLPALLHARFDPSVFIVAGDHFVNARDAPTPIVVRPHSVGYDGQFYYGMALNPLVPATRSGGVTFDHPAWRWQRILYPLMSFVASLGNPRLLPAAMLGVNLLCLAALGVLAVHAVRSWGGGGLPAWAFLLWPGFLTCLTHDTTELLACACLLGAAMAWLRDRLLVFSVLAACATLTRETSSLMLAGVVLAVIAHSVVRKTSITPAFYAAAALVPVVVWHLRLAQMWHGAMEAAPVQANLGLPFIGIAQRLATSLGDTVGHSELKAGARLTAAYTVVIVLGILAFSGWVAACLPALLRRGGSHAALGVGWLFMMALISLLSARGPWIDPTAIFRAFSECWVLGWLILLLSGARASIVAGLALLPLAVKNWQVCLIELR